MALTVPITVRTEAFEGPLDLLLHLIQQNELDITSLSVSKVTDPYLTYVRKMQDLDLDIASEFLILAATLLLWKSRALLPKTESTDANADANSEMSLTEEDLVRQLQNLQRYKASAKEIGDLPLLGIDTFVRNFELPPAEKVWKSMQMTSLALSYQNILKRKNTKVHILKKETVSLTEKIQEFSRVLTLGELVELRKFLMETPTRGEVVVTFLASLELSRLKRLRLHQEKTFGPIYLELIESLKGFDIGLATGFDAEPPKEVPETAIESL